MAKKITGKQVLEEIKAPALVVVGLVGSSLAGKAVDKILKVDETAEGFNAKALAKPVVQLSAGLSGALLLKDKNLKLIATGVAASGVASSVKVLLKKDLLAGFESLGETDALQQIKENLILERYNPNLPELNASDKIETVIIEQPKEEVSYDDYEEVDEVQII